MVETAVSENRLQQADVLRYMLAGKAIIIFHSLITGDSYRYRIRSQAHKHHKDLWYVYSQPSKTEDRKYLGAIRYNSQRELYFKDGTTPTSREMGVPTKEILRYMEVFKWVFDNLVQRKIFSEDLHILHEGTCGKCGRPLTDSLSVRLGIGPQCRGDK